MSNVSKLLISLTKNERPWAICSRRSEEMSDVSESLIRSFLDKKRAIRSEIKWANSQPCFGYS